MSNNVRWLAVFLLLVGVFCVRCEEDQDTPEGTLWFCILKYKASDQPIAVWASRKKPLVYTRNHNGKTRLTSVYARDNDGVIIFKRKNINEEDDEIVLDYSVIDVKKIVREYPKYAKFWKGPLIAGSESVEKQDDSNSETISDLQEDLRKANNQIRDMVMALEEGNSSTETRERDLVAVAQNISVPISRQSYTYKIKRKRGDDFKYRYYIIRSDGEEVWTCDTQMEADKLIPFLK